MALSTEIRLFDTAGVRRPLPDRFVGALSFEVLDKGGYGTFTLDLLAEQDDDQLPAVPDLNWRIDVYFDGVPAYRGWVEQTRPAVQNNAPLLELTGAGIMGRLHTFLVDCEFAKPYGTDISQVFAWISTLFLSPYNAPSGERLGSVLYAIDQAIGYDVERVAMFGADARSAFDNLTEAAQDLLIWGYDFHPNGNDRLYVQKRPTTVIRDDYIFRVGKDVQYIDVPSDLSEVVNAIKFQGGKGKVGNLVYNPSFELPSIPGEGQSGNLLLDPSFELNNGSWTLTNGASIKSNAIPENSHSTEYARTGTKLAELDNNSGTNESISQVVTLPSTASIGTPFVLQFFFAGETTTPTGQFTVRLESLDNSNALLETLIDPAVDPDGITRVGSSQYQAWPSTPSSGIKTVQTTVAGCAKLRLTITTIISTGNVDDRAVMIDDVYLCRGDALGQDGWEKAQSKASGATATALMAWAQISPSLPAFHGCYYIRAFVNASASDYMWIRPSQDHWINSQTVTSYVVSARVRTGQSGAAIPLDIRVGLDVQYKDKSTAQFFGSVFTTTGNGTWENAQSTISAITNAGNMVAIRPIVELQSNGGYDLDAIMAYPSGITTLDPGVFYDGENLSFYFRADNGGNATPLTLGGATGLSTDAQGSITTYGLREAIVNVPEITDVPSAQAFAVGYLNKNSTPKITGKLVLDPCPVHLRYIDQVDAPSLQGQIRIDGTRTAITPKSPAKIAYSVDTAGKVRCEIDLDNRRPDPALLLKNAIRAGGGGVSGNVNLQATGSNSVGGGNGVDSGAGSVPIGGDCGWWGSSGAVPSGWLLADGSAVSRTTYAALFAALGTTFGVGDGSTTFNVPDCRDRFIVGAGSTYARGATGGAASHSHTVNGHVHAVNVGTDSVVVTAHSNHSHTVGIVSDSTVVAAHASHTHDVNPASFTSANNNNSVTFNVENSPTPPTTGINAALDPHTHDIDVPNTTSGTESAALTHTTHAHLVSGNTSNENVTLTHAAHSHTTSGNSGSASPGTDSQSNLPPYIGRFILIRAV